MSRSFIRLRMLENEEKEVRKKERVLVREIREAFDLPEKEFLEHYKISQDMIHYICSELREDLEPKNGLGYSVTLKVLNSLKILLNGHYQRGSGQEAQQCVAQTTVSKYLNQFIDAVNARLKPKWVTFPGTPEARNAVATGFLNKSGLPQILGAIDCTHIKLFPPPGVQNAQYRNRHGEMTINVQLVADVDGKIINCNANFPGRCHDQFIFNNSVVKDEMRMLYEQRIGQYFLLGDSGYALEPWLLTPITNTDPNTPEDRYTNWHCSTRNVIERTNGYLKGTFRSLGLDRRLHYMPRKASKMIYACCTLYNIMKHFRIPLIAINNDDQEEPQNVEMPLQNASLLQIAQEKRRNIIETYFTQI